MKSCLLALSIPLLFCYPLLAIESFAQGQATPAPGTTNISFNRLTGLDEVSSAVINNIRMCDRFAGANAGAKIAACIADLPSTGGVADSRGIQGAQTISTPIVISKPVTLLLGAATFSVSGNAFSWSGSGTLQVHGLSLDDTTIFLSGAASWNFNPGYSTTGIGFSDLRVLSDSPTSDAVTIGDGLPGHVPARVEIRNVVVSGPGGSTRGSAHGIKVNSMAVSVWNNVWVYKYPGDALHIVGDLGAENHFNQFSADSVGGHGVYLSRTTVAQVGGWYFTDSIVSNIDRVQTQKGVYIVGRDGGQAELNFNFVNGGIDVILGGDAFYAKNTGHLKIIGNQILSLAAAGANCDMNGGTGCYAGIHLFNVNDALIQGNSIISNSRAVSLEDIINLVRISDNILIGDHTHTVGYFIETRTINKGYIDISNTTTLSGERALARITNDYSAISAVRSSVVTGFPEAFGWTVGTLGGAAGSSATFKLTDLTSGASMPNKFFRVNNGNLEIKNSGFASTPILQVTDTGDLILTAQSGATPTKHLLVESGALRVRNDALNTILQIGDEGSTAVFTHLNQGSANQWAGTVTIAAAATTGTFLFPTAYGVAPACTLTPLGDPGAGTRWWATISRSQVVANVSAAPGRDLPFSLICIGNPD